MLPAYGHLIHDTHPFGRQCSIAEMMMESSNIGMAQIADQLGTQRQKAWLKKMGFLDRAEIELKERGRPLTPGSRWGPFETMTIGFGQGIAVAPLQLAMGYATLFDGGIYHPPTILKVGPDHPLAARPARVQRRHQLSDALAAAARGDEGDRQKGGCARLSHRRQDRHRAEDHQRPL